MSVLMIAFGIYILGVSVILFVRPAFMFRASSGTWKEFGLGGGVDSPNYTIFPFWMFALVWALLSYVGANFFTVFLTGLALQSLPADVVEANISNVLKPVSKSPPPNLPVATATAPTVPVNSSAQPGYYVLETPKAGPPKYVYFGTAPPTVENMERLSA